MDNNEVYLKVSDLNEYIKVMFDENDFLHKIYLKGEISNFKNHTRGHLYFTLKDETSRINAVMFYNKAVTLDFTPEDGMNVLVTGRISCYPAQGTYQIYVDKMTKDGLGNLYIEYEKLKKKLASEGLFSDSHKKPIPKYPKTIGVITAPTGAAIKDIISTIKRRFPLCEVILFPSLVQGKNAAPDIAKQIKVANTYPLDVLIVGRGGGSIEDLWAFNEEIVARSIYESKIPIISAVGHEIDFTIADYVADLRAPTPTGAAEMAVPTTYDTLNLIYEKQSKLNAYITNLLKHKKQELGSFQNNFILKNPMSLYEIKEQKLDHLLENLQNIFNKKITDTLNYLENCKLQSTNNIKHYLEKKYHQKELLINTLKLLNPLNVLDKGYSLVTKDNEIISDFNKIKVSDELKIKFKTGEVKAIVKEKL